MPKKLIIIALAYVLLTLTLIVSCTIIEPCGPFASKRKVANLNHTIYKLTYNDSTPESSIWALLETDTVLYSELAISVSPVFDYYSYHTGGQPKLFINSAMACSPARPKSVDYIDSIVVTTNTAFGPQWPANTNIAALFTVMVDDMSYYPYHQHHNLHDWTTTRPSVPDSFLLNLNQAPSKTNTFEFTVTFYQNGINPNTFSFCTQPVTLLTP